MVQLELKSRQTIPSFWSRLIFNSEVNGLKIQFLGFAQLRAVAYIPTKGSDGRTVHEHTQF